MKAYLLGVLVVQVLGWIFWTVRLCRRGWPVGPALPVAVLWPVIWPVLWSATAAPRS